MGRRKSTKPIDDLRMARLAIVDELSYSAIAVKLGLGTKNTVCLRLKKLREEYPEFIQALELQRDYTPEVQIEAEEGTKTLEEKLSEKDLADKIQDQIHHLLDLTPEQIRNMKTEHRLRHVDTLVRTMRLLREESTDNVKQLSLISCISIATERRKPKK